MYLKNANTVQVSFGSSCANSPHLASHIQETGTGDDPLADVVPSGHGTDADAGDYLQTEETKLEDAKTEE